MKAKIFVILIVAMFASSAWACQGKPKKLDNTFYCFNNAVGNLRKAPKSYEDKAALIKKLGFDGLAGQKEEFYYPLREGMDKVGLEMPEMYIGMSISEDGKATYHEELENILKDSKDRNLLVALHLSNKVIDDPEKAEAEFVRGVQKLADFCKPLNIRIAVYPHVGFYCEKATHSAELVEKVNRRNVGAIFNLCHHLKLEGSENWKSTIDKVLPYLFMVSINGADNGDKDLGWGRLIQPLGDGTFDVYGLVKYLKDNDYDGKFGLQCYGIKLECEKALAKSMSTWKSYQRRYERGANNGSSG